MGQKATETVGLDRVQRDATCVIIRVGLGDLGRPDVTGVQDQVAAAHRSDRLGPENTMGVGYEGDNVHGVPDR